MDTNAGLLAALIEGIVQSYERSIVKLLPALPAALHSGYVRDLCLRGDMSLSMIWRQGEVAAAIITARFPHHWLTPNKSSSTVTLRSPSMMRVVGEWLPDESRVRSGNTCMEVGGITEHGAIEILFYDFPCSLLVCHPDRYGDECISDIRATFLGF